MSRLFAHNGVDFATEEVNRIFYHDGVNFSKPVNRVWTHDGAQWVQIFPGEGSSELPAGAYVIGATSQSLGTSSGFAEFDTVPYRGRITEIACRVSWKVYSFTVDFTMGVSGRPIGNFYRNIANNNREWDGRTIDHRIDTFDASSLTDFNTGAAIGFTYSAASSPSEGGGISARISNTQLELTIV